MNYTKDQEKVIYSRACNLLVSAAAGSGKTAVLVERIIQKMLEGIDIDRMLVVTFTRAAAGEMRERIGKAIDSVLEKNPEDSHMQKQSALLHHASICTIDSFCQTILRNYFREADIDPGFRIADENEVKLIAQDLLAELLEEKYEEGAEEFLAISQTYGDGQKKLEELVLSLRNASLRAPFPKEFYVNCMKPFMIQSTDELMNSDWMKRGLLIAVGKIRTIQRKLEKLLILCDDPQGPAAYRSAIEKDMEFIEECLDSQNYEQLQGLIKQRGQRKTNLTRITKDVPVDEELKKKVMEGRNKCYKGLESLEKSIFLYSPREALDILHKTEPIARCLIELVRELEVRLDQVKKEKNILDFSDIEHKALAIMVDDSEGYPTTELAKEYRSRFDEIMIDEYQDSNDIQELLLSAISGESEGNYNRFMVGDVKQSIYRFRNAKPALFLQKYDTYTKDTGDKQKIELDLNFRSRESVLDSVNSIFEAIMHKELGGIEYDKAVFLKNGADYYPEYECGKSELLLIQNSNASNRTDMIRLEARCCAARIKQLYGKYLVCDKRKDEQTGKEETFMRPCSYKDMVILIRSGSEWFNTFRSVLEEEGIPAFVTTNQGYFAASEIRNILSMLQVINNPREDIPLYGAVISPFGGFSEEEIASIKSQRDISLYEAMISLDSGHPCFDKVQFFIEKVERYRVMSTYMPVSELLNVILNESGYLQLLDVMRSGNKRRMNVLALIEQAKQYENTSFHGLFHFLRYIENLKKYEIDFGEADFSDENADLVRLMTIHKSKGLEFPICIVCGLGKGFNATDEKKNVQISMDYGMGLDYVNQERKIKLRGLHKHILSKIEHEEMLAEEMRTLYVALTRAKEKLIMTGACSQTMDVIADPSDAKCMLDWILYAEAEGNAAKYTEQCSLDENSVSASEIKEEVDVNLRRTNLLSDQYLDSGLLDEIRRKIDFDYQGKGLSGLMTKVSVSELKHAAIEKLMEEETGEYTKEAFSETDAREYIPAFVKEKEPGGTQRGNAYHKCMELFPFSSILPKEDGNGHSITPDASVSRLDLYLNQWVSEGRMQKDYVNLINQSKIRTFLESEVARRMAQADRVNNLYKEQPFVLGIPASRINDSFPEEETVLIQGIIDVFFVEEDGIVLLDYKTDSIKSEEELVNRYKVQIDYYTEALERLMHKKVKERILYSFSLEKEIFL